MEMEKIYAYINQVDITIIKQSVLIIFFVYALFELFRSVSNWYILRHSKRPPGPIGLPFVGYLPFLGEEPHKTLWNVSKKYGGVISVYLGPKYTVFLNKYEIAKEVLAHPGSLDKVPELFEHLRPFGFGMLNGERWLEQRRFTMSTAKDLGLGKDDWGTLIMEELSRLIKKLTELKGKPYDISDDLADSLNISMLCLLIGRRLSENEADKIKLARDYVSAATSKTSPSDSISLVPGMRKIFEIFKISGYDTARNTIAQFQSFLKDEIMKHKTSSSLRDNPDFINCYLEKLSELAKSNKSDHAFSETMLQGNLGLLFLGASDTVYSSVGYLLRIMSKHKDIQDRVHTELIEVLGKDGQARYQERDKIPYTFAVIMEGQRHGSISPLAVRKANQDIPVKNYIIPKGADITTNLWALHNDPDYWDEPEEFRPERFLTDGGTKIQKHPLSYAPFSYGKRNCPAETIAWMEILYYFSEIVKRFEISTPPGVKPEFNIIHGIVTHLAPQPLCFKERNI